MAPRRLRQRLVRRASPDGPASHTGTTQLSPLGLRLPIRARKAQSRRFHDAPQGAPGRTLVCERAVFRATVPPGLVASAEPHFPRCRIAHDHGKIEPAMTIFPSGGGNASERPLHPRREVCGRVRGKAVRPRAWTGPGELPAQLQGSPAGVPSQERTTSASARCNTACRAPVVHRKNESRPALDRQPATGTRPPQAPRVFCVSAACSP